MLIVARLALHVVTLACLRDARDRGEWRQAVFKKRFAENPVSGDWRAQNTGPCEHET